MPTNRPAASSAPAPADRANVPVLSLVLGYGAALPFILGAVGAWLLDGVLARAVVEVTTLWGAAILAFLAGVRRGLSFRTDGGPTAAQITVMGWLFACALAALLIPPLPVVLAIELAAFLSLAVIDPWAARRGEAPLFFTRLRPVQMPLIAAALGACLARWATGFT